MISILPSTFTDQTIYINHEKTKSKQIYVKFPKKTSLLNGKFKYNSNKKTVAPIVSKSYNKNQQL